MNTASPPRRPLRSAAAVIAGLVAVITLSLGTDAVMHTTGVFPPMGEPMAAHLWILASAYRAFYAVLGSFIAARLAPSEPMRLAVVLGVVGVFLSTVGVVATWDANEGFGPKWFPISLVVTALPCAWLGGKAHQLLCKAHHAP